ncbi:hypothetical protein BaRGS_00008206 [Batillaria attramentaria]|uniref:Uncharacterized protein n=1 Tax=Batillaria attramentaria TaxID=370345 RepID=A0ABD0LN03_9CAEN
MGGSCGELTPDGLPLVGGAASCNNNGRTVAGYHSSTNRPAEKQPGRSAGRKDWTEREQWEGGTLDSPLDSHIQKLVLQMLPSEESTGLVGYGKF